MKIKTILNYALGPVGSGMVGILTLPIISWIFTIEDVGRLSMIQVFTSFSVVLFGLGLDQAYVRDYHDANKKASLLKNTFFPSLCLFCITAIGVITIDLNIISELLFGISDKYLSILTILTILLAIFIRCFSLILRMQEKAFAFSMSQLLPKITLLILVISCFFNKFGSNNIRLLLTLNFISILFAVTIYGWNTHHDWSKAVLEKIDWKKVKLLLNYSLPLFLSGLAVWCLNVSDRIFLRYFSNFRELGVYSVSMNIAAGATILSSIFNTIWAPTVFKWNSENKVDYKIVQKIFEALLMIIYYIIILVGVLSQVIPYFLPIQYVSVQYILSACIIGPLFYTLSEVSSIGIVLTKKTKYSFYTSLIAMLLNFALCFLLIPKFGAIGAAISMAISYWVFYFFRTHFSNLVWQPISSYESSIITFALLTFVVCQSYFKFSSLINYSISMLFLVLGLFIFNITLRESLLFVKKYFSKEIY